MGTILETPPGFSFRRTVLSHGWCVLPPFRFDPGTFELRRVLRLSSGRVVEARISEGPARRGVRIDTPRVSAGADRAAIATQVRHMLRLDEDYSGFYEAAASHPPFAWIPPSGAGRLLRSPTVFEDLVKLICTTNCTWSLTRIMVGNLVGSLGEPAENGPGRAFPTPEAMAARPARFYEKEVRAGYRAGALAALAGQVASGRLDVEGWIDASVPTVELTGRILSVRGAGPYTAENLLKLLGRYEGLAIDSWCRTKYLQMYGPAVRRLAATSARRGVAAKGKGGAKVRSRGKTSARPGAALVDASMARRYGRFGVWRGLALWCDLTKDWLEGESPVGGEGDKF